MNVIQNDCMGPCSPLVCVFFRQLRLRLEALSHEGGETECEPGDPERPGTLPETVGCLVEDIGNAMMQ